MSLCFRILAQKSTNPYLYLYGWSNYIFLRLRLPKVELWTYPFLTKERKQSFYRIFSVKKIWTHLKRLRKIYGFLSPNIIAFFVWNESLWRQVILRDNTCCYNFTGLIIQLFIWESWELVWFLFLIYSVAKNIAGDEQKLRILKE